VEKNAIDKNIWFAIFINTVSKSLSGVIKVDEARKAKIAAELAKRRFDTNSLSFRRSPEMRGAAAAVIDISPEEMEEFYRQTTKKPLS